MNTAQVIPFKKPSPPTQEAKKSMYSDKFEQGYVMSSRLYRKEVWPFLSDAARNVYVELENRINGHNKESDFVSYSQLQGGDLSGSRKLSRETVRNGIDELLKLKVVSISGTGPRGVKKYVLNEISIKDKFANQTSSTTEPVRKVNQTSSTTEPVTSSETEHTIDSSIDTLELKKEKLPVDNFKAEMFGDSVEYHVDNKNLYSLRELASVYPIQSDLTDQAKQINSDLEDSKIMSELKNFAQWSTSQQKTTAQGWMNYWIYRIQNLKTPKAKPQSQKLSKSKSKVLSDKQIDFFASKLCNNSEFASMFSNVGESQKEFEVRISACLRDVNNVKKWASYLHSVGFVGQLEDFA